MLSARRPGLGADRRAVAAVEFALLAPALVGIALALYDSTNAAITLWQVASGAHAVALIATDLAATPALTNTLTQAQAIAASTAVYATLPALRTAPAGQFAVTLTSVAFTASPAGCAGAACTYAAHVAWSATLQGNAPARPCGTLAPVPDGAPPSPTTLPADAFSAAPVLIADVSDQFIPLLTTPFAAAFTMRDSAYLATRIGGDGDWVHYTGANAAQVQCPGYTG